MKSINKTPHRAPAASNAEQASDLPQPANEADLTADSGSLAIPGREAEESEARELHRQWLDNRRTSTRVAIKIGGILTGLKAELKNVTPKQPWESYVLNHLGIQPRTASNYMRIFREASNRHTIGNALNPETISDCGIREVLDYLADLRKTDKNVTGPAQEDDGAGKKTVKSSTSPLDANPLRLADGREFNLKRIQWVDGPISRRSIESWIDRSNPGADDPKATKVEARRQSAVVQIAAVINRACGRTNPEVATELIESSLDVIRTLMREAHA